MRDVIESRFLQVDFVNSVQFSNHTGYPSWKGTIMDGDQLWEIVEGLQTNGLLYYDYLVTGRHQQSIPKGITA